MIRYNINYPNQLQLFSCDYNDMMVIVMMMAEEKNTTDVLENITSGNEAVMHFSEQFSSWQKIYIFRCDMALRLCFCCLLFVPLLNKVDMVFNARCEVWPGGLVWSKCLLPVHRCVEAVNAKKGCFAWIFLSLCHVDIFLLCTVLCGGFT